LYQNNYSDTQAGQQQQINKIQQFQSQKSKEDKRKEKNKHSHFSG